MFHVKHSERCSPAVACVSYSHFGGMNSAILLREDAIMSKAAKRLGRGLDSLISNLRSEPPVPAGPHHAQVPDPAGPSAALGTAEAGIAPTGLPIESIIPNPFQPRHEFDQTDIEALAESIRSHGLLQPIMVRKAGSKYQIIAGERRWRAAKLAGLREIPAVARSANDQQMLELALVENLQRQDLNAIDRAKAYRQFSREFGLTAERVADRVGEDRTTVTNYLRLLDLEPELQGLVASNRLSMGHARSLLGVSDKHRRSELAKAVIDRQLSVRALEDLVRAEKVQPQKGVPPRSSLQAPHLKDLESRFEQAVKTKVLIKEGRKKGTGKIVIEYYTLDDFDRIAGQLGVEVE